MVPDDIPLNQGCLKPIDIRIPEHSLLCPGPGAAVVGGNVLTSQRVTDVVLKAFLAASASQVKSWFARHHCVITVSSSHIISEVFCKAFWQGLF